MPTLTRRTALSIAACGVLLTTATACGDGAPTPSDGATVEITHALGTTTVPADVQRVVALGPTGVDVALALDAPVVGASASGGDTDFSPWTAAAVQAHGGTEITVLPVQGEATEVDLERVAALQPDLIFAPGYFVLDQVYPQLSGIAATIGYQSGPAQDTWQQMTRQLGTALGRENDAERVVAEVEGRVAEARSAHPSIDGATYTFALVAPGTITALRDPDDATASIPAALGMTLSPSILAIPPGESFGVSVSGEQVGQLDADVLMLTGGEGEAARTTLAANPLFAAVGAAQRDAIVTLDYDEFIGMRNPSPLSVPWYVDRVVPRLGQAAAR